MWDESQVPVYVKGPHVFLTLVPVTFPEQV